MVVDESDVMDGVLGPLIDDLARTDQPLGLVLDDFHLVDDPLCHMTFAWFIERSGTSPRGSSRRRSRTRCSPATISLPPS